MFPFSLWILSPTRSQTWEASKEWEAGIWLCQGLSTVAWRKKRLLRDLGARLRYESENQVVKYTEGPSWAHTIQSWRTPPPKSSPSWKNVWLYNILSKVLPGSLDTVEVELRTNEAAMISESVLCSANRQSTQVVNPTGSRMSRRQFSASEGGSYNALIEASRPILNVGSWFHRCGLGLSEEEKGKWATESLTASCLRI